MVGQPPNHGEAITLGWLGETLRSKSTFDYIFSVARGGNRWVLGDICRVDLTWSGGEGVPSAL